MFARRPQLPQVNKSKWASFPGSSTATRTLDDARRWRFYTYILSEQVPPPYESVLRCEKHAGFSIRFSEGWQDILPAGRRSSSKTGKARETFDAVIVCTGFDVNLLDRPEVAPFRDAIETWRSHVPPREAEKFPEEARFPYLGDAFQLQGDSAGNRIACTSSTGAATMSHGALAGDIPGIETGVRRLVSGIVRDLFLEDADALLGALQAHNEDELKPTRLLRQSIVAPTALTTSAHFARSDFTVWRNWAGDSQRGVLPSCTRRSRTAGVSSAAFTAAFTLLTMLLVEALRARTGRTT